MEFNIDFTEGVLSYVSLPGLASLSISALLGIWSKSQSSQAQKLGNVRRIESLAELPSLANALPVLVAVFGRVTSDHPIQCEMSSDKAVIREITEEEHVWKTKANGSPTRDSIKLRHEHSETEWFLVDNSQTRVRIEGGSRAQELSGALQQKQVFNKERGSGDKLLTVINAMMSIKREGTSKTERYLPIGTVLTVVGELAQVPSFLAPKDISSMQFSIRKPQPTGPFYITKMSLSELQGSLSSSAVTLKWCAWVFGVLGTFMLVRKAVRRLVVVWQQRRMRKRLEAAEKARAAAKQAAGERGSTSAADEGSEEPQPSELCVICLENKVGCVYVPCGHLCCCYSCGSKISKCPICRTRSQAIKVYRP